MKNYQLYKLFPTPVFHFKLENYQELNTEVTNYILNLRKKDERGQKKSNYGGWHSDNFDIDNDKTAIKFASIFEKSCSTFKTTDRRRSSRPFLAKSFKTSSSLRLSSSDLGAGGSRGLQVSGMIAQRLATKIVFSMASGRSENKELISSADFRRCSGVNRRRSD